MGRKNLSLLEAQDTDTCNLSVKSEGQLGFWGFCLFVSFFFFLEKRAFCFVCLEVVVYALGLDPNYVYL